ncbi:MAG TPA: hypothetical protein VLE44_00580 [Candidatus Saccharimonadales bacterium]|nr:hypothetical protein [Candidatus Saccharimonadales bacterium]
MITLTDRKGKEIENPTITDIQKALNDLYLSKDVKNVMENYVSLINSDELDLEIYQQTIVLQDWGRTGYDGPGGPSELLRIRYKEGSLSNKIEEAINLLDGEEREKLIELLKFLPKPE